MGKKKRSRRKSGVRRMLADNQRILLPVVFVLALFLVAAAAIGIRDAGAKGGGLFAFLTSRKDADPAEYTGPVPLVKSGDQNLIRFVKSYYDAVAAGDIEAISGMLRGITEEEKIRIQELAVYIDSYPEITVYTKTGPEEGTRICYIVTKTRFVGHDWKVPGLQTLYVCKAEDGSLFINNTEAKVTKVADYIQQVSVEDDVVDLSNEVTAQYNQLITEDATFSSYLNDLSTSIDLSVGMALSDLTASRTEPLPETTGKFLLANTIVNVRLSPSEDADRIGQTVAGGRYALVERLDNGWSEIIYGQRVAYVKSEYFTVVDSDGMLSGEKLEKNLATAREMVAIRSGPGTDYDQIGWARPGDVLTVESYQPYGWSTVSYNGQSGYVKSDYFTFE